MDKVHTPGLKTFHELHNELEELLYEAASGGNVDVMTCINEIHANQRLTETDKQILLKLSERVMQWVKSEYL